ncbi:unnamed protein product [Penicillium olsonii]|uniref:Uncharacterized protein n=1 Tax=Penicillium olsonii TaxID=99116 RepID=A0A9W4MWH3_PENOL|nr:unnamed protein product [Penicillium olsonii]CAG8147329.1 unnamed protein product [Penicillium olsonii]
MHQILLTTSSLVVTFSVLASFLPQIRHVWLRKESGRVCLNYILLNLISSVVNLFLPFFFTVNAGQDMPVWAHVPRIALDWINLAQLAGIWALFNVLFCLAIYYSPISRTRKAKRIAVYIFVLVISLEPLMIDATTDLFCSPMKSPCDVPDLMEFFMALHQHILQPVTLALMVISFYGQAHQRTIDLSPTGLKLQSFIFFISAVWWMFRINMPWDMIDDEAPLPFPAKVMIWLLFARFTACGDAIFAIGQYVLLRLVLRKSRDEAPHAATERQPLLNSTHEDIEHV